MIKENVKITDDGKRNAGIHELILDMLSNMFHNEGKVLLLKVKKDDLELHNEYESENFFLCKFCGSTFGVNEKEKMPPVVKFTVDSELYHIDFQMNSNRKEVVFKEKDNEENFISVEVYKKDT